MVLLCVVLGCFVGRLSQETQRRKGPDDPLRLFVSSASFASLYWTTTLISFGRARLERVVGDDPEDVLARLAESCGDDPLVALDFSARANVTSAGPRQTIQATSVLAGALPRPPPPPARLRAGWVCRLGRSVRTAGTLTGASVPPRSVGGVSWPTGAAARAARARLRQAVVGDRSRRAVTGAGTLAVATGSIVIVGRLVRPCARGWCCRRRRPRRRPDRFPTPPAAIRPPSRSCR